MKNTESNTMSIFAEALISNLDYKNARVDGAAVGVSKARLWNGAVKAMLIPAYAIRVHHYNHMGVEEENIPALNTTPFWDALKTVLEMVGEVNGAKLNSNCIAEEVIAHAMKFRVIDTSPEMAHAHNQRSIAKKAMNENETEETIAKYDEWVEECKRLEDLPGNCKKIPDIQSESTFVKAVEHLLGAAITKQNAKSAEEVEAEKEAQRAARRAKTAAKKAAKKAEANA